MRSLRKALCSSVGVRQQGLIGFGASLFLVVNFTSMGCQGNEGIHASQLDGDTQTPIAILQLDQTLWHSDILIDDEAIQADTTANMFLTQLEGSAYELYLNHSEGSLIAGSVEIPADTWLKLEASLIEPEQRLYGEITDFGHTMSVDFDVYERELVGYVTIDAEKAIYVVFERDLSYEASELLAQSSRRLHQ